MQIALACVHLQIKHAFLACYSLRSNRSVIEQGAACCVIVHVVGCTCSECGGCKVLHSEEHALVVVVLGLPLPAAAFVIDCTVIAVRTIIGTGKEEDGTVLGFVEGIQCLVQFSQCGLATYNSLQVIVSRGGVLTQCGNICMVRSVSSQQSIGLVHRSIKFCLGKQSVLKVQYKIVNCSYVILST